MHAVSEAREHCAITGQNNVGVEVPREVNITLQDETIEGDPDTGMTESLSAKKPLFADGDNLAVSKLVFSGDVDEVVVSISCLKSRLKRAFT